MKKLPVILSLLLTLSGTFGWSQGSRTEPFDAAKTSQELEIMKGILGTTLSFVTQSQKDTGTSQANLLSGWRYANIDAFYLYGQGAVFVIPTSSLRIAGIGDNFVLASNQYISQAGMGRELAQQSREMAQLSRDMQRQAEEVARAAREGSAAGTPPPQKAQPPKPPVPPEPPAPPAAQNQEELRKRMAEAQEKVKKSREDMEARRAKFIESLGQVKEFLIEALANYGDSMTTVKPNEYINIVILTDGGAWVPFNDNAQTPRQEVISAQKSWISDYKAGRLTLDAFKQKILQYNN